MRFITFVVESSPRPGLLTDDGIVPLDALDKGQGMLDIIRLGDDGFDKAKAILEATPFEARIPTITAQLLAPIPVPAKNVFCVGRNYHEHVEEGDKVYGDNSGFAGTPPAPIFFTKPATSVVGSDEDVVLHSITQRLDYEIELAAVIGMRGFDIKETDALKHVWGYTIVNDVTARDLQDRHKQWFKGKGLDSFCPMGPWIIHHSDIADPHNLDIQLSVNGEVRQSANTGQMIFNIPRIIQELSSGLTIEAGDIIATGTCSGCAFAMDPPAWLEDGDVMELRIEGIGTLRNTVRSK